MDASLIKQAEQEIVRDITRRKGLSLALRDSLPSLSDVRAAYDVTAIELLSDESDYRRLRAQDLITIGETLSSNSVIPIKQIYSAVLDALLTHRLNLSLKIENTPLSGLNKPQALLGKSIDCWAWNINYAAIDPDCIAFETNDHPQSTLSDRSRNESADNKILELVFSKLPSAKLTPLPLTAG